MYYDRTCGTLLVTRCAWLERSRVSFSSSRRCAFAFSRLRFQGVRHDPVSESLRVLRRGLARRSMTRHHRLSRRRTPPRSRLHLRFESNSRATAVAPNVPRTVPQRAIGRARDRDARSGRRSIGGGPSGGRRPPLRLPPLGRQDRPPLGPPPLGRQDRPPLGPPPLGRQDPRRRAPSSTRGPRPSRSSGRRVAKRFPRGSAGALVSRRGPRRRRRTNAGPTLRGGRTVADPRARGFAGTLTLQLVQLLRRTLRIRREPLRDGPSRASGALTTSARRGGGPRRARGSGSRPRGRRRGGPRSRVSVSFSSRVEPRSTARRRDGGRGRVPADVRPDFGFHGYEPRSGRSDAGRGRSPVISRVAEVNFATSRGRSRGGARAVPRSR